MLKKAIVFTLFVVVATVRTQNYCRIESCRTKGTHTMCMHRSSRPARACSNVQRAGLTNPERNIILNMHNQYRRNVARGRERRGRPGPQPASRRMPNLVWDNQLASVAQRWANQCNYGHDACRDVPRFQVGQNIAEMWASGSATTSLQSMVKGWYEEVAIFNRNDVKHFRSVTNSAGQDIGHYTQMLWANTTRIGCGIIKYRIRNRRYEYLVCNYGPAGNIRGRPMYAAA